MFGEPPADYVPTAAELDMRERLLPTAEQRAAAVALLDALDVRDEYVYVALALPGARRGYWDVGQPVEHVDGVWLDRDGASRAACAQLGERDGVPCYAAVWRDGEAAVFEDFRLDRPIGDTR